MEERIEDQFRKTVRRKTIRAFSWFFFFVLLAVAGWTWLNSRPEEDGALLPLRKTLKANEKIFSGYFSNTHLAPEYPKSKAEKKVRVNGDIGMSNDFNPSEWKLQVVKNSD